MRARIALLALVGSAALVGPLASNEEPAAAALPSTSYNSETNCGIPDGGSVDCPLVVADAGTLVDVNVSVRINHTFNRDLDIFLVAPDNSMVELSTDNGVAASDDYGTGPDPCDGSTVYTTFDDSASTAITAGLSPFAGTFQPESQLSAFNGESRAGTWNLRVFDDLAEDVGEVICWRLTTTIGVTHHQEANCVIPSLGVAECDLPIDDVGTIEDVDVRVRINHASVQELGIALRAPDDTQVQLATGVGGTGDNFGSGPDPCDGTTVVTNFDDSAPTAITSGAAPFAGSFRPEASLAALAGQSRAGTWTLVVGDPIIGTGGTVICWGLTTTTGDTDGDGLNDDDELDNLSTDPLDPDTDDDGLDDGAEVDDGWDPLDQCSPPCQPDARIRASGSGAFTGDGTYNSDGTDQTTKIKVKRGKTALFDLDFENDGPSLAPDDLTITDEGGRNKFKITYLAGAEDVTGAVQAGGYDVPDPGGDLLLKVKVKQSAAKGSKLNLLVTATSQNDTDFSDTVKAVTKVK